MKGRTILHIIISMITNIFFLILLVFFGINFVENLFTYGHTPETQFWLFFLMTWVLIYIGITAIGVTLEKKYFPSKKNKREIYRKWFFTKHEKKKKYINKKKAYLCMVLFDGGLLSAFISGVIVIYIFALVPYEALETYLGYNSIIGQILNLGVWGGAIMFAVGGILGIRGALDETEA